MCRNMVRLAVADILVVANPQNYRLMRYCQVFCMCECTIRLTVFLVFRPLQGLGS